MKLAILGEKKSILGFKALGIDTFGITSEEDFQKAAKKTGEEEYAILFITEELAEKYEERIEKLYKKALPAILIIPGISPKAEKGKQALRKIIEKALGSEIIKIN